MHEIYKINNFIIILNHRKDSQTCMIESYINNGYIDEDMNNAGISHLLEHVAFDGWDRCKKSCNDFWKKRGVVTNASTGQTSVNYYIYGLKEYTNDMLDYIISVSCDPIISEKRLNQEKIAVFNEMQIYASNPNLPLYNMLNKLLFLPTGLQYQDDAKLQIKNLKNITPKLVKEWVSNYYGSGNTVFCITGNFKKKSIVTLLNKKLKKYKRTKIRPYYQNIFKMGLEVGFHKNKLIDNTSIFLAFHSPIYYKDKDVYYIDFFKNFINSSVTSILFDELREKLKLIYGINIESYTTLYGTYFIIELSCKNKDIELVITTTINVLKNLSNGKFSSDYMNYVKKRYLTEYYETCKNNEFLSSFYGEQYLNQLFNIEDTLILSPKQVLDEIKKLDKLNLVVFIKKLINFANLKIAYQGKRQVKNLQSLVLKRIE